MKTICSVCRQPAPVFILDERVVTRCEQCGDRKLQVIWQRYMATMTVLPQETKP